MNVSIIRETFLNKKPTNNNIFATNKKKYIKIY